MSPEQKRVYRTSQEIMAHAITKRAETSQLLAIYNLPEFKKVMNILLEELRNRNHVPFEQFKIIHDTSKCDVSKEKLSKARLIATDIDFGTLIDEGSLDRYECEYHGVYSSNLVTDSSGYEQEARPYVR